MRVLWTVIGISVAGLCGTSLAHADCGHAKKSYPEKSTYCHNGSEFVCGEMGAWHRTGAACDVNAGGHTPPTVPLQPAKDAAGKEKPQTGSSPPSG